MEVPACGSRTPRTPPGPGAFTSSRATSGSRTCGHCRRQAARTTSLGWCSGGASRGDPSQASASRAVRTLWAIRWKVGKLLGWDGPDAGPGSERPTLRDRLPADLRDAPSGPDFAALPFTSLYLTGDEWAAEIVNRTVHGIMHIGWIPDGTGGYRGQMAVLVKPNGLLGTGYMAAIRPFRHLIVYPPMLREVGRGWRGAPRRSGTGARVAQMAYPRSRIGDPVPRDRIGRRCRP
jgi:Protein of unknown function (DUF2867)